MKSHLYSVIHAAKILGLHPSQIRRHLRFVENKRRTRDMGYLVELELECERKRKPIGIIILGVIFLVAAILIFTAAKNVYDLGFFVTDPLVGYIIGACLGILGIVFLVISAKKVR